MTAILKVYVRTMEAEWGYSYKKFKPTGRWKTVSIIGKVALYVEHQGLIFKEWFEEEDIIFELENICINNCGLIHD